MQVVIFKKKKKDATPNQVESRLKLLTASLLSLHTYLQVHYHPWRYTPCRVPAPGDIHLAEYRLVVPWGVSQCAKETSSAPPEELCQQLPRSRTPPFRIYRCLAACNGKMDLRRCKYSNTRNYIYDGLSSQWKCKLLGLSLNYLVCNIMPSVYTYFPATILAIC